MSLKEYRINLGISAQKAALSCGVPFRTYQRYEHDENYGNGLKREAMLEILKKTYEINEDKGILTVNQIRKGVSEVFEKYKEKIDFCMLFGSYAKGYAKDSSDIDLCISTDIGGLEYVGLIEELRSALKKRVELLRLKDITDNVELVSEIMKDGIKIYG
ncbi:MAG: nucleotidyltransferase domain-containing protein [Erysipelotrichaceae bacterium]|nr:nucleotidyltransferase domain-containing protein [Erysipelotrichaceae bacterium]